MVRGIAIECLYFPAFAFVMCLVPINYKCCIRGTRQKLETYIGLLTFLSPHCCFNAFLALAMPQTIYSFGEFCSVLCASAMFSTCCFPTAHQAAVHRDHLLLRVSLESMLLTKLKKSQASTCEHLVILLKVV
ncbi:hypothetical protein BKA63DRAFT_498662 [Paraphoma chrysanthemicola]|nr:hypothetical protein BKA63DRAFT_498662 [Paraphoma chrysanthemicola]